MLLMLTATLCCRAAVETTDISTWDNAIYIEPSKGQIGTTFDIILRVRSEIICSGYQTDITLPEGVSVAGLTTYIVSSKNLAGAVQKSGAYRVLHSKTVNADDYDWEPGDYEVIKISLTASPSCVAGDYPITFANNVLASETGNAGTDRKPATATCQLTLTDEPVYDEGYSLGVKPMSVRAGLTHDDAAPENSTWLFVSATNAAAASQLEFTIGLPDGVSVGTYESKKKTYTDPYYASDVEFAADDLPDMTDNGDGTYSVVATLPLAAGTADYIKIPLVTEANLAPGIHDVNLYDVEFTVTKAGYNGRTYKAAPATGALIVAGAAQTAIDVTALSGLDNTAIDVTDNPNTIIVATAGQVSNASNVVVDGTCSRLTLTDGYPFGTPVAFTATEATYSRTTSNTWGTLCLPYAVSSTASVQYYELLSSAVAADGTGTMTFTPVATVEANTPVVFRKLAAESTVSITANNSPIAATAAVTLEKNALEWTLCGSYSAASISEATEPYAFYIKDNSFYHVNTSFSVMPFHAWFRGTEANASKTRSYSIDGGDGTTAITEVDATTADPASVYDLNGRRVSAASLAPGVYIKDNKKIIIP